MTRRVTTTDGVAVLAFLTVAALVATRIVGDLVVDGQPQLDHWGLIDFRDAVYYPARAFLDGINPYDVPVYSAAYPIAFDFPLYSPMTLALYWPLALADFNTSAYVFLALNIGLLLPLAWLVWRCGGVRPTIAQICAVGTLLLVTRGGYVSLALGQCTVYVTLGLFTALAFANTRPWLAGFGLAIGTLKPTFGVPIALLMLARGRVRPVVIGAAIAAGLAAVPATILTVRAGGVRPMLAVLEANYQTFADDPAVNPVTSPLRVDAVALVARIAGSAPGRVAEILLALLILAVAALALRRLDRFPPPYQGGAINAVIICCATLLCAYHQVYDVLLLTLPIVTLITARPEEARSAVSTGRPEAARSARQWALALLLILPVANHAMSRTALGLIGRDLRLDAAWVIVLASVNGAAILLAFAFAVFFTSRAASRSSALQPHRGRGSARSSMRPA